MPDRLYKFEPCPILLVDDLEENLLSLSALLKNDDLEIITARSGVEALEILLKRDIALALVDVQMPDMNGFELAELMRGTDKTRMVPIIFVTAGTHDLLGQFKGYDAGAVDFIAKPIEDHILKSKVNVFRDLYRKQAALIKQRDEIVESRDHIDRLLSEAEQLTRNLQAADKNKDEFLATLAHELRNPMAPIQNALDILKTHPSADKVEELHNLMSRHVKHMIHLIDDLMDMARVSQGKIKLRKETINVKDAIHLAIELSEPLIKQKNHAFTVEVTQDDMWMEADLHRISQIIGNLLQNAAKYTDNGGRIELKVEKDVGHKIHIAVADNGIGIPAEKQSEIFNTFSQLKIDDSYTATGLGIGLSLVKKLVHLHAGDIRVESEGDGKGATFHVMFPALVFDERPREKPQSSLKDSENINRTLKILVVDDNREAAETLSLMLELFGHQTVLGYSGEDAVRLAHEESPQMILLDIGLPDISGYEVAQTLRSDEKFKHTYLVAQTGWGQKSDRDKTKKAGFDKHLVKPISMDDLQTTIAETVG